MNVNIQQLNRDIEKFPQVTPIDLTMEKTFKGVSRLIMLDRYAFKDTKLETLKPGDLVVATISPDPNFPARGIGNVNALDGDHIIIKLEEQYAAQAVSRTIRVHRKVVDKPLEVFYEQIARRNARGLAAVEKTEEKRREWEAKFYEELVSLNFVPAGRVIYGAGSDQQVTFFNCFVMPYPKDSREGIAEHRSKVMEIMSRGGGVGTNGTTLRPRNALARGVNGKSSGSVSWLDDIAKLTHLVEQGGSRRGAQMIMLQSDHPDIIEFIISKMQNPKILRFIIDEIEDDEIRELAKQKLKFTPLTESEAADLNAAAVAYERIENHEEADRVWRLLHEGGRYTVHSPEFLSGANISVAITDDFMQAVEEDEEYALRFPDVENYDEEEMAYYNEHWHEVGDVREWPLAVRTYRTIKAKQLWDLINICATYAAEPGVFFIDNANNATNAKAYGQKVVATNPCGEQPLAPWSVCNLSAVNLAKFVDKKTKQVDFDALRRTVEVGVRMQDNIIDATPYFLEANRKQALGERRVGLGVMGLADMLIYAGKVYGSEEGNELVDEVFKAIAITAYKTSVELAKEKGPFPFLDDYGSLERNGLKLVQPQVNRAAFVDSGFVMSLPTELRKEILEHGIRNSHLLTVAPTGSTGSMVGVSTGLEPYFAFKYFRSGRLGKFMEVNADIVTELGVDPDNLPPEFVTSMDLRPEAHVDVQCVIQRWVDSSLSKTVNAPKGYAVEQVQAVYERLYAGGAKGGTVYVDGSRDTQVLSLKAEENTRDDDEQPKQKQVTYEAPVKPLEDTKTFGTDIGNTCPVCREGNVIERAGCHECDSCGASLRCGL